MKRRDFLRLAAGATAGAAVTVGTALAEAVEEPCTAEGPVGILRYKHELTSEQREQIRQAWEESYAGRGGVMVVDKNYEYQAMHNCRCPKHRQYPQIRIEGIT